MTARTRQRVAPASTPEEDRAALRAACEKVLDPATRFAERAAALRALATLANTLAANLASATPDQAARQLSRHWDGTLTAARSSDQGALVRELKTAIGAVLDLWEDDLLAADPREVVLSPDQLAQIRRALVRKRQPATPEWLAAWVMAWVADRGRAERGEVMPSDALKLEKARISRRQVRSGDAAGSRRPRRN